MLIPELSFLIALGALFLTLLNTLLILWARQDMRKSLLASQQEQRATNSAVYGLARHLRSIQLRLDKGGAHSATESGSSTFEEADKLVDGGIDTLRLSEELGVSQNEAEIIAHLRPRRKKLKRTA